MRSGEGFATLVTESVLEALFSVEVAEALVGVGRGGFGFGPVVVERCFFLLSCCGGCEIAVGCDVGKGCGGRLARPTILGPMYRLLRCSILYVDRLIRTQLVVSGGRLLVDGLPFVHRINHNVAERDVGPIKNLSRISFEEIIQLEDRRESHLIARQGFDELHMATVNCLQRFLLMLYSCPDEPQFGKLVHFSR